MRIERPLFAFLNPQSEIRIPQSLQVLLKKRCDLPTVQIDPGLLATRVMSARQPRNIERNAVTLRLCDHVAREINRKRQIITRGDETHGARSCVQETLDER